MSKVSKEGKEIKEGQSKFFVDLRNDHESLEIVNELLGKLNNKHYGSKVLFKDMAMYSLRKLSVKDLEAIQELSLSDSEKLERLWKEHVKKSGKSLSFEKFLLKKCNAN
jgi:hypothetical protein